MIPEICLQYTKVFTTLKLELAVALFVGIGLGILIKKYYD
jgi:hypothetical protein